LWWLRGQKNFFRGIIDSAGFENRDNNSSILREAWDKEGRLTSVVPKISFFLISSGTSASFFDLLKISFYIIIIIMIIESDY